FATLLLDLDHFKEINDALGHAAGDEVLREVGRRLSTMQHDARMIARLGGDEFAVLIDGGQASGVEWANRLLTVIRAPVKVEPYALEIDGSVGIAVHPDHSTSADELLSYADLAMYEAKAERLGVSIFGTAAAGQAVRHLAISTSMRTALGQGQITAVYQPQIDLRTEQIVGVEALARWTHPELGPIRPEEFVRVAEQAGLLHELTDAMVDDALQWQRRWAADGFDLQVAVNINPRTLLDAELPRRLARAVDQHSVAADRLTVEITEGSVMTDPPRTRAVLARIHDLGVKVSIDDFGTGYSSLAYLQDLPADEVKIDKSFVLPMAGRRTALPLVSGIIRLCHELGFTVVAEGIERSEVQATLRGLGCDRGQGFVIARPMAAEDITTWALAHRDRWTIPKERRLN
ncbi:MAG TPA: bifunctional diguanylate cyclase/phosphodiesterase, partial [Euzebya sp.]|nr:bifunctional diguanylate cyclase/phosphodiesterase [Euzebya sp.]